MFIGKYRWVGEPKGQYVASLTGDYTTVAGTLVKGNQVISCFPVKDVK